MTYYFKGRQQIQGFGMSYSSNFTLPLFFASKTSNGLEFFNLTQTSYTLTNKDNFINIIDGTYSFQVVVKTETIREGAYFGFGENYTNIFKTIKIGKASKGTCNNFVYFGRLEAQSVFSFIPFFALHILIGVLLVYFRNDQPLKSRGSIPFILYSSLMILFQYYFLLNMNGQEWASEYYCIGFSISFPFVNIALLSGGFVLFRYIVIINLNKLKLKLNINNIQKNNLPIFLKALNFLSSDLLMFIISIIIALISWICCTIISIYVGECIYLNSLLVFITMQVISTILGYSSIVADIIINFKIIYKCQLRRFFIEDDIYFFRVEAFGILVIGGIGAIVSTFLQIRLLITIVLTIVYYIILFFGCLFVLIITIFKKYYKRKSSPEDKRSGTFFELEKVFQKEETNKMFEDFCKNEFNIENVLLKKFIRDYKLEKYLTEKKNMANEIFKTFINHGSIFQVNISSEAYIQVKEAIEKGEFTEELFEPVEKDLTQNLMDIFLRFSRTKKYMIYQNIEKIKKEMV